MAKLLETVDLVTNFYTYEGVVKALDHVSLSIDHGITFGLVGESGCGKSVTVRSMMRIIQEPGKVEGGKILFYPNAAGDSEAIDLLQQTESYMRAMRGDSISMIFQEPNAALNPIMSIGDQISESFLFHRKGGMCKQINADLDASDCPTVYPLKKVLQALYRTGEKNPDSWVLKVMSRIPILKRWDRRLRKEALRRSIEIIEKLGIANGAEIVRRYPHNLSGGMKQRIVIAIALACNPVLLIADEATSNLDVTIQAQILELLRELKQKEISSILLITHDLGIVAETCDRVGVMYAGNLCEVADIEDIFRSPKHPYTQALLNSVPRLSQEGELKSIEGSVPNLVSPPPGCRFHPRCPHVMEVCKGVFPEMKEVAENHQVACYWVNR
ncbi:MAG: ABC transporter ATP-binding protein [Desulfobacteraceae bacterium]|jgi:peptide/nickel transport system ATP-binding protein|nr:ABC transporter ATP-binding protein [Desulfobacteraceae bacterium]